MHPDLTGAIEAAKAARDGVLEKTISVKEANSVAANNQTIITAHAIDLRERIFLADTNIPQIPHQSTATDAEAA